MPYSDFFTEFTFQTPRARRRARRVARMRRYGIGAALVAALIAPSPPRLGAHHLAGEASRVARKVLTVEAIGRGGSGHHG